MKKCRRAIFVASIIFLMTGAACTSDKNTDKADPTPVTATAEPVLTEKPTAAVTPTAALTDTPVPTVAPTATLTETPVPTATPQAAVPTDEELQTMIPILDSMAVGDFDEPMDDDELWDSLYVAIVNYADPDGQSIAMTDSLDRKEVTSDVVRQYASAFRADFAELPPLDNDDDEYQNVVYDAERDVYSFAMSDRGEGEPSIDGCTVNDDGTYSVTFRITIPYDDNQTWVYHATMIKNTYQQNGAQLFPYTVIKFSA